MSIFSFVCGTHSFSLVIFFHLLNSLSSKDDVLEFDTKISEDDMGGNSNSTGEFDLGTAVELLGLDDEDAKTQASKLQGAYMSFLLLRHLRLRDLQRSVRNGPYFINAESIFF